MPKNKTDESEIYDELNLDKDKKQPEPIQQETTVKLHYTPTNWKDVIDTFRCENCGYCDESEDDMILHVVKHVPESERETLLDQLLSSKKENK